MINKTTGHIKQHPRVVFSNGALVTLIQEAVAMLHKRGMGALARETLASELDDLPIGDTSSLAHSQRSSAPCTNVAGIGRGIA